MTLTAIMRADLTTWRRKQYACGWVAAGQTRQCRSATTRSTRLRPTTDSFDALARSKLSLGFGLGWWGPGPPNLAERRDSAKTSRTRQASCSNWPKSVHGVFAGNVSVPVCKSTLAGSKRISRKGAKTQSVDSLNSFPSSFAPWRLCARPSSSQRPSIRIDAAVSFLPLHLVIGYWELNIGC